MLNRRNMLRGLMMATAGACGGGFLPGQALAAAAAASGGPKRIIFFLQNQGFDPKTCVPAGMASSGSLAKVQLPEPIRPLERFK